MGRLERRDGNRKVFIIRVLRKKKNGHPRYIYGLGDKRHPAKRDFDATGTFSYQEELITVHIHANSIKQANEEAKKYGKVQSGQVGHSQKPIYGDMENLKEKLDKERRDGHGTALELEEFPWQYKKKEEERKKVRERRENETKEKGRLMLDF